MDPRLPETLKVIALEWRQRSRELAEWAMSCLVNRSDVWVQFTTLTPEERLRSKRGYKAVTLPKASLRGSDMVTLEKLDRHFGGLRRHHLIGLHAMSAEETSRWFAIDIDLHGRERVGSEDRRSRNLEAALAWWEILQKKGYDPLLFDSNGAGGFHVWVIFREPAPTPDVFAFAQSIIADWDARNLDMKPETYPRHPHLGGNKVGSALRLPGLHHVRDHLTRVWSGEAWIENPWLEGTAAIDVILNTVLGPPPPVHYHAADTARSRSARTGKVLSVKQVDSHRPRVCVDLDGLLLQYHGWRGESQLGEPIDGAVEFTRNLAQWAEVIVYTARDAKKPEMLVIIREWLERYGFSFDEIVLGKPLAHAYVDDRAISCRPQEIGPVAFRVALEEVRLRCDRQPKADITELRLLEELAGMWALLPLATQRDILQLARAASEVEHN